jgi:uncharacterized protein
MKKEQKFKEIIIKIIKKYIPESKIYLFGSRARKTHSEGADIDLAVDTEKQIDFHLIEKIKDEIENKNIPFFVDIVDLQRADENFKSEVKRDGIL